MKIKIMPQYYWATLTLLLLTLGALVAVVVDAIQIYLGYKEWPKNDPIIGVILFFAIFLYTLSLVVCEAKATFSMALITSEGITASFLGKVWFLAKWDEIVEVGLLDSIVKSNASLFSTIDGFYLSKVPDALNRRVLKRYLPDYDSFDGNLLFISIYNLSKQEEILKHVDPSIIVQHGRIKLK